MYVFSLIKANILQYFNILLCTRTNVQLMLANKNKQKLPKNNSDFYLPLNTRFNLRFVPSFSPKATKKRPSVILD